MSSLQITDQDTIRERLAQSLSWEAAHVGFEQAVSNIPYSVCILKPFGMPYSIWELTEHCRIAQRDILEYCKNPYYTSPEWPTEYWPDRNNLPTEQQWEQSVQSFIKDLNEMAEIIRDPKNDLFRPFENGSGHNLFREAAILIDHTAYHTGQIVLIRKILDVW